MPLIVNLTNIPAPYREKVHELVADHFHDNYTVIYCARLEPNRDWKFEYGNYDKIFLAETSVGYIHNNPAVWAELNKLKPKIVISTGFNPTMLYAFIWCLLHGAKHIAFTDGTFDSEKNLSFAHRLVRKVVYSQSKAFIGAGKGSRELYKSYQISDDKIFNSCLAINNLSMNTGKSTEKLFTLMFSGQLIDRKMPLFFVEVAKKVKKNGASCKVLILGAGELRNEVEKKLSEADIEYEYPGFIDQSLLPSYYSKAKIFLFPTRNDPWGIVANEAMAAGVPVITCANAGVAGDLVIHNENGYVLPLNADVWVEHILILLNDQMKYDLFSQNASAYVKKYNFETAAKGITNAVNYCK